MVIFLWLHYHTIIMMYNTLVCVSQCRYPSRHVLCVTMLATCRQMLCRFDTLADMKIGRVGDMADDMSPTCRRHDTRVCKSGHETTRHKTT